jgi:hypothetical protein
LLPAARASPIQVSVAAQSSIESSITRRVIGPLRSSTPSKALATIEAIIQAIASTTIAAWRPSHWSAGSLLLDCAPNSLPRTHPKTRLNTLETEAAHPSPICTSCDCCLILRVPAVVLHLTARPHEHRSRTAPVYFHTPQIKTYAT